MRRRMFSTFSGLLVLSVCLLLSAAQEVPGSKRKPQAGRQHRPADLVTGPPEPSDRAAGHNTSPGHNHSKDEFIRQLFLKYGDGESRLTFAGFSDLLGSIGLGVGAGVHDHRENGGGPPPASASGAATASLSPRPPHRHADHPPHDADDDDDHHHHHHPHHDDTQSHETHRQNGGDDADEATSAHPQEGDPLSQSSTTDRNEHTVGLAAPDDGGVTKVGDHSDEIGTDESHDEHLNQCLTSTSLLGIFEIPASGSGLTEDQFLHLCPVLLQQLDSHVCMRFDVHGDSEDGHWDDDDDHHQHGEASAHHDEANGHHGSDESPTDAHADQNVTGVNVDRLIGPIWGYGVAAISLISLASIACILIVPCMQHYPDVYHRLISFLVAMAVGTLAGDAMMHLIPHSLGIHVHDDKPAGQELDGAAGHAHEDAVTERERALNAVWKGFFVLVGIFSFFVIEQMMAVCQQARRKRKAKRKALKERADQKNSSQRPLHRPGSHGDGDGAGDDPAADDTLVAAECAQMTGSATIGEKLCHHCVAASTSHGGPSRDLIRNSMFLVDDLEVSNHIALTATSPNCNNHHHHDDPETAGHHGHSHGHGHSHEAPPVGAGGIATLAWIVVMGDGLHNFCDGLIVGAAYADSIAGGLSTSIAVMCHEIPHELGDFAVMLKGGMTIKQALLVQLLSSVLAYLGLAIGIAAGNVEALSTWIFALAGGMFVYIALVDLFPELIETLNSQPGQKLKFLFLESLGTLTGISIMLFIGLHEDWLREQLDA